MTKLLNSLSTYTSDNIRDIKAVLFLINNTLSDKNLTALKRLSENFNSEVDAAIADIKSTAKQKCSLDGVISNLSTLSDLCKDTVSKSGELIEKVSYANAIMKMQKSFNVKIEHAVEGRYGIIKIAPTNTKELNGKILEMNDLLKDLNEEQWGKILEKDKEIRKAANGNSYKLRQYKSTLEDLQDKFSSGKISLKGVINQLKNFTFS